MLGSFDTLPNGIFTAPIFIIAYLLLVQLEHSMHDRNVPSLDLKNNDLSDPNRLVRIVGQEEQVASMECRFHAA